MYRGNRVKKQIKHTEDTINHVEDIIEHKEKEKETIDDSVRRTHKAVIEMPLTDDDKKKHVQEEHKKELEKKAMAAKEMDILAGRTTDIPQIETTRTLSNDNLKDVTSDTWGTFTNFYTYNIYSSTTGVIDYITKDFYESGDIQYKSTLVSFEDYVNTTLYNRATYKNSSDSDVGMLVAGDVLVFTTNVGYMVFYVNEVMYKNDSENVASKINTGIQEKPATTVIMNGDSEVCQTAKDTHGNVYVMKKDKTIWDISPFLATETKQDGSTSYIDYRALTATNVSKDSDVVKPDDDDFESVLRKYTLKYENRNGADCFMVANKPTYNVTIPDSLPTENTSNTTVQDFNCYIKGYFMVFQIRSSIPTGDNTTHVISPNTGYTDIWKIYSFEINEYSPITCSTSSGTTTVSTNWFTATLSAAENTITWNAVNNVTGTAPFCATGGFYPTNVGSYTFMSGSDTTNPDVTYKLSDSSYIGFAIWSAKGFTGENSFKMIYDYLVEDGVIEEDEDEDEIMQSQKVSEAIKTQKTRGCAIV